VVGSDVLECAIGLNWYILMYRLGRLHCKWNLGTICSRTEREHGERDVSVGRSQQSYCQSQLLYCARV